MYEIQEQGATGLPRTRLDADLSVSISVNTKNLYLRCRLHTAADVNVIPVSVYKNCFMTTAGVSLDQYKPM